MLVGRPTRGYVLLQFITVLLDEFDAFLIMSFFGATEH